jgi:predicted RNA-binding Zn ribbon-like protein
MTNQSQHPDSRLHAGHLALDFVNTRFPDGFLQSTADLIRWCQEVGAVDAAQEHRLLAESESYPEESQAFFTHLTAFREASHGVVVALLHQIPPASSDLDVVQSALQQARMLERLIPMEQQLAWEWGSAERGLTELYWRFCRAVELVLTSALMQRVKECPPDQGGCGWVFLDKSKNGSRRWCADGACGSRMRMRRWYERKRESETADFSEK